MSRRLLIPHLHGVAFVWPRICWCEVWDGRSIGVYTDPLLDNDSTFFIESTPLPNIEYLRACGQWLLIWTASLSPKDSKAQKLNFHHQYPIVVVRY
ncbi:ABC transporter B family member 25 [Gossypium australe]|uniref:ABC transporter B family member 25 n=1 Tax=Gossypium australe TaxID=47621 RepID=A0A5B6UER6_9ROSI|nr:ABC transporter B family member 25 [Gossypium australe]